MGNLVHGSCAVTGGFVYFHVIVLLLLIIGTHHLFSLPAELEANWIFQITEGEGRGLWLRAVDRFVLFWGAMMLVTSFPIEVRLLGWRGVAEAAFLAMLGLLAYEWVFSSRQKLPFTCSRPPCKAPIWMVLAFFGLIAGVSLLQSLLLMILYNDAMFFALFAKLETRVKRTKFIILHAGAAC